MAYFEELRDGSFRNVAFVGFTASDGGGRRGKVNQFPKSDDAQFNDRGRKTKPFVLSAAVFGEDALSQADALEDALNKEGPGRLVHPTRGEMQATCTDYTRKSVSDAGLRVNFTIEFFKQPEKRTGVKAAQNPGKAAEAQEQNTNQESASLFEKAFKVAGQPAFIFEEARKDFIKMTAPMTQFLGDTNDLINGFTGSLDALLNEPLKLAQATQDLIGSTVRAASFSNVGLRTRTSASSNAFSNTRELQAFETGYESVPVTTTTRQVQQNNSKAIQLLVRQSATVVEAELHQGSEGATLFTTRDQAQQALKTLLKEMQVRKNESSDLSAPLSQLMAATATASSAQYGILADERTIEIQTDTDSIVLAYELYDDFGRESEIRTRNNLTDTFIKKGTILKVSEQ